MGRGSEPELSSGGSESAGPHAPGAVTARVQVGPGAAPMRLIGSRASKTGADGSKRVGPTVLRCRRGSGWRPSLSANSTGQRVPGRGSEPETANCGSESARPSAPCEGVSRVQVGSGAAPKRLDDFGRASKTGIGGSKRVGPTVLC